MSRRAARRADRRGLGPSRPPSGGLLHWLLALPARLRMRWLTIVAVLALAMGAYAHVLMTADPMPPGKAPVEVGDAAGKQAGAADGEAPGKTNGKTGRP